MNLANATARAQAAKGPREAARLYNDIEYELALGDHPPDLEAEGERALELLGERFAGVRDQAREIDTPPHTSRRAGQTLNPRPPRQHPSARARRPPPPPAAPRQRRSGGGGGIVRRSGRAIASGAGSVADTSWGSLILQMFVWGMALSIGYLFLTRAGAAAKLFEGATNVTRALVSPVVDPLNPKGAL